MDVNVHLLWVDLKEHDRWVVWSERVRFCKKPANLPPRRLPLSAFPPAVRERSFCSASPPAIRVVGVPGCGRSHGCTVTSLSFSFSFFFFFNMKFIVKLVSIQHPVLIPTGALLIFISLMTCDVCMSSLVRCLFRSFGHFNICYSFC